MSSTLNNPSADKSAPTNGTTGDSDVASSTNNGKDLSRDLELILTYFSAFFQSKLPVAEHDIDPARSPELETLKIETKDLPDNAFKALFDILRAFDTQRAQLAVIRSQAENNTPLPDDILKTQHDSLMKSGVETFMKYGNAISKSVTSVDESEKKLVSRIREAYIQAEGIKHNQSRLDAVKDDIIPQMPTPMKPFQNVAKVGVSLAACDISRSFDKKLKALDISREASRGDMEVMSKTRSKLQDYLSDRTAIDSLIYICKTIYPEETVLVEDSNATATIILERIDFADHTILRIIPPIANCLAQWQGNYGIGITIIREVNAFCDVVPRLIEDIERIFGAKEIIKSSHQVEFGESVYNLGFTIFKYLGLMRDIFNQKKVDPEKQREFQQVSTLGLLNDTTDLISSLSKTLNTESSSRKSEKAEKNRKADDRCFEDGIWTNKTLVKPGEVQAILDKVKRAVGTIYCLASASGTGQIMEPLRGDKVERADFKLDISIEPLRRLHQVLGEDVDAGLERLEKLLIEQEPKAQAGQIKSFLRMFNRYKR